MTDIETNCSRDLARSKGVASRPNAPREFLMNPIAALDVKADYAPAEDVHWNTAGHHMIGVMLSDSLRLFGESRDLSACDTVISP